MLKDPPARGTAAAKPVPNLTQPIVAMIARTRFEDLPAAAIRATKRRVLDLMGCGVSGARDKRSPLPRAMTDWA